MTCAVNSDESELTELVSGAMHDLSRIDEHAFASQRTMADQIEHEVRTRLIGHDPDFAAPQGVRRPADVTWRRFHINIKSMDLNRSFHMPNLISADSLWRLLARGDHFMLLRIAHRDGIVQTWDLCNIQDISWDDLTLAALGAGQIQIRDGTKPLTMHGQDRTGWIAQWRQRMIEFYQHEHQKITRRLITWSNR